MKLRAKHTCNTPSNAFGVGMRIASPKHIKVLHIDKDGNRTKLGHRDYTVEATSYPTDRAVVKTTKQYESGDHIIILHDVPLQRESNYTGLRNVSGDMIEGDMERINEHIHQLHEVVERCLTVPHNRRINLDATASLDKLTSIEEQVLKEADRLRSAINAAEKVLSDTTDQAKKAANGAETTAKAALDAKRTLYDVCEQKKEMLSLVKVIEATTNHVLKMFTDIEQVVKVNTDAMPDKPSLGAMLIYDGEKYKEIAPGRPGQVLFSTGNGNVEWKNVSLQDFGIERPKETMSSNEIRRFMHKLMHEFK